ncbi:MAG: phosphatase PAP2 family protein [Clostridia bacterium]|nr:phosphatase PAP2 family protein [Clostridia bacterium]
MTKRLKICITATCVAVFLSIFILATFFDYQISEAIARLSAGKYLSDNPFGKFFEVVGEVPMYLVGAFAVSNLAKASLKIKNKIWAYVLFALCVVGGVFAYALMLLRATEYVYEHSHALEQFEKIKSMLVLGYATISIGLVSATLILAFKIPDKHLKGLIVYSVAMLLAIALSQGGVQGIKVFMGRQRYRTMKVLEYYGLNNLVDYTKWFEINGKRVVTEEMLVLGIAKDGYKSFPSGHTCSWALIFGFAFIPDFLAISEKKRLFAKSILLVFATVTTLTLAYTRILVGAHFATDVLFAGAWTYLFIVFSTWLCKKLIKVK